MTSTTGSSTGSTARPRGRQVSISEAAAILGVSGETIRRKIHAGELEGIRSAHPRGAWRVTIPSAPHVEQCGGHAPPHVEGDQESVVVEAMVPTSSTGAPAVEAGTDLGPVVAQLAGALVGLTGQLETARAEVADLRERLGRLGARLEHAEAALSASEGQLAASERRARLLALVAAVLVVLALVAGALVVAS